MHGAGCNSLMPKSTSLALLGQKCESHTLLQLQTKISHLAKRFELLQS